MSAEPAKKHPDRRAEWDCRSASRKRAAASGCLLEALVSSGVPGADARGRRRPQVLALLAAALLCLSHVYVCDFITFAGRCKKNSPPAPNKSALDWMALSYACLYVILHQ